MSFKQEMRLLIIRFAVGIVFLCIVLVLIGDIRW